MRYVTVFLFLYDDHVCALAFKFDGFSIAISKRSIITATEFPNILKNDLGIVLRSASLSGQYIRFLNMCSNNMINFLKIIDAVELVTLNLYPKSVNGRFNLNFIRHNKSF